MTDKTADTVEAPELMPRSDPGPVPAGPAPMRRSREQYLAAAEHYLRQALSECDGQEHPAIGDLLRACMNLIGALAPDLPEPHQHKSHTVYPETHSKR